MTFDFFEGAAGTGKTHNLVGRAGKIVQDGILGEGHKLLALTFMNGARRRLDARLGENPAFRRRFDCQTFDVFARTVASRRRSLITSAMQAQADALSEFDGPCALAAGLLENEAVQKWVARSFPLILVDEAQDLDEHRMRVLQGLSPSCRIVAAADAFQCLHNGRDTAPLMGWLGRATPARDGMISLSDAELAAVMEAARPIPARDRDQFLRDCAAELSKYPEIGPGIVSRITSRLQREYLNGPRDLRGVGGKWER
jgi:hypothetical protein